MPPTRVSARKPLASAAVAATMHRAQSARATWKERAIVLDCAMTSQMTCAGLRWVLFNPAKSTCVLFDLNCHGQMGEELFSLVSFIDCIASIDNDARLAHMEWLRGTAHKRYGVAFSVVRAAANMLWSDQVGIFKFLMGGWGLIRHAHKRRCGCVCCSPTRKQFSLQAIQHNQKISKMQFYRCILRCLYQSQSGRKQQLIINFTLVVLHKNACMICKMGIQKTSQNHVP